MSLRFVSLRQRRTLNMDSICNDNACVICLMHKIRRLIPEYEDITTPLAKNTNDLTRIIDHERLKGTLVHFQAAIEQCFLKDLDKDLRSTEFVASIGRCLREQNFITLLDVDYGSNCLMKALGSEVLTSTSELSVMLPENTFGPFLRYRISEQLELLNPNRLWRINMISSSGMKQWIANNVAKRLEIFSKDLKSIPDTFPNEENITVIIKDAFDTIDKHIANETAYAQCLYHNNHRVGSSDDEPYNCSWHLTVRSLKGQLVKKTIADLADRVADRVAHKITKYSLDKIKTKVNEQMLSLRNFVSEDTFQHRIRGEFLGYLLVILYDIFGALLAVVEAVVRIPFTAFFKVDVNSTEWREKVAREVYDVFSGQKDDITLNCCNYAVQSLQGLKEEIMKGCQRIDNLAQQFKMPSNSYLVETFSNSDFERMKECVSFANVQQQDMAYVESKACVCDKDENECMDGYGEKCTVLKGSEVIAFLHHKKVDKESKGSEVIVQSRHKKEDEETHLTRFPFVPISLQRKNKELSEIKRFKEENRESRYVGEETYENIRARLNTETLESLLNNHSNLVAVDICTTKSRNDGADIKPCTCIVLFCFGKGFIPIGENLFPRKIADIPTDVRESYALTLGTKDYNNPIGPGCSVGLENRPSAGSIGFLLAHKDDGHYAFLSAAHVFMDFLNLRDHAEGRVHINSGDLPVVQPSDLDNSTSSDNRICGHIEYIHFNKERERNCKDFVVVRSSRSRHPVNRLKHPTVPGCLNWPKNYEVQGPAVEEGSTKCGSTVVKCGRTTELTRGKLAGKILLVNISDGNGTRYPFYDMMKIDQCGEGNFAENGDSGAGIFLEFENILKPFGMVEALMISHTTLAIPIGVFKTTTPHYDFQCFNTEGATSDDNVAGDDDHNQDHDDDRDDDHDHQHHVNDVTLNKRDGDHDDHNGIPFACISVDKISNMK